MFWYLWMLWVAREMSCRKSPVTHTDITTLTFWVLYPTKPVSLHMFWTLVLWFGVVFTKVSLLKHIFWPLLSFMIETSTCFKTYWLFSLQLGCWLFCIKKNVNIWQLFIMCLQIFKLSEEIFLKELLQIIFWMIKTSKFYPILKKNIFSCETLKMGQVNIPFW